MNDVNDIVISLDHVKKSFGANEVLKDVSLKVKRGESVVTLGKSGSGKSVALKCIVGLMIPDSGNINVLGKNIPGLTYEELQYIRKKIGFVFQSGALYDSMTVGRNIEFPLSRNTHLTASQISERIERSLDDVGLLDAIDKMPSELSGGMRKRAGVARTIALRPQIMLWDEPTTGLDPETTREISRLIVEMKMKYDVTSIIVTHDMACARMVADRIIVLENGVFTHSGTYQELMRSNDAFVKSFFSE